MSQAKHRTGDELFFWLGIMGDHARFIKDSLKPGNPNRVLVAENFINLFDRLGQKLQSEPEVTPGLLAELLSTTLSLREFKRELLGDALRKLPVTALSPTFYNHMLNELEQFLIVINELQTGVAAAANLLGEHLLWVLDAAGHAAILMCNLDKVEYLYREEAKAFENSFDKMYLKAVELAGYYRSSDSAAAQPVLEGFNSQIITLMQDFIAYLEELKAGSAALTVVGELIPLVPDHMLREGHYYLKKLSES